MNTNQFKNQNQKNAFTLVEMLIVLTMVSILFGTVFAIIFVVIRQQARIFRLTETRRQGDTILNFMKEKVLRATAITDGTNPICNTVPVPPTPPTVVTASNGTNFVLQDTSINYSFSVTDNVNGGDMIYSQGGVPSPLNNARVRIKNFIIACVLKSTDSTPIVQFSYTVSFYDATPSAEEGTVNLEYRSKVQLR